MKAVILAAGQGPEFARYRGTSKCLIEVDNATISTISSKLYTKPESTMWQASCEVPPNRFSVKF